MADGTKIEWTEATWNPITGCTILSAGCTNCYAMRLAGTRLADHPSRAGLTREVNGHHVWTGEVRFNDQWHDQPLRWGKPRMIFVCAHGDLFHESVPDEWIDRVFAVMALVPQHTFQVLTKRSGRMREYLIGRDLPERVIAQVEAIKPSHLWNGSVYQATTGLALRTPLANVWLGVSAEDQRAADERIPDLRATPAAVRFISAEPLLGPIELDPCDLAQLDWVIAGCESGRNARFMDEAWVRSLLEQCQVAGGIPFFYKQRLDERGKKVSAPMLDGRQWREFPA